MTRKRKLGKFLVKEMHVTHGGIEVTLISNGGYDRDVLNEICNDHGDVFVAHGTATVPAGLTLSKGRRRK